MTSFNILIANDRDSTGKSLLAQLAIQQALDANLDPVIFEFGNHLPLQKVYGKSSVNSYLLSNITNSTIQNENLTKGFNHLMHVMLEKKCVVVLLGSGSWPAFYKWTTQAGISESLRNTNTQILIPTLADKRALMSAYTIVSQSRQSITHSNIKILFNPAFGELSAFLATETYQKLSFYLDKQHTVLDELPLLNRRLMILAASLESGISWITATAPEKLSKKTGLPIPDSTEFQNNLRTWLKAIKAMTPPLLTLNDVAPDFQTLEQRYIQRNPDIAEKITQGEFTSAYEHYLLIGRNKGLSFHTEPSNSTQLSKQTEPPAPPQKTNANTVKAKIDTQANKNQQKLSTKEIHRTIKCAEEQQANGSFKEAIKNWKRVLEYSSLCGFPPELGISQCYHALGKNKQARNWMTIVSRKYPEITDNHVELGRLAQADGDYETAAAHWYHVFTSKTESHSYEARLNLARCLSWGQDLEAARDLFELVATEQPQLVDHDVELGRLALRLGDYIAAPEHWQRVLDSSAEQYHSEAQASLEKGKNYWSETNKEQHNYYPDVSLESLYLTRYPDIAAAVANGNFISGYQHYVKHGRLEGRRYRTVDDKDQLHDLQARLAYLCQPEKDEKAPVDSTELAQSKLDSIVTTARQHLSSRAFDKALPLWQHILDEASSSHGYEARRSIAQCHRSLGNRPEAQKWFELVAQERPDIADHQVEIARLFQAMQDLPKAMQHWQRVIEMGDERYLYEARLSLGRCSRSLSDFRQARGYFEAVIQEKPDDVDNKVELGRIMMQLKEWRQAAHYWIEVLASNANTYKNEALGQLGTLCSLDNSDPSIQPNALLKLLAVDSTIKNLVHALKDSHKKNLSSNVQIWIDSFGERSYDPFIGYLLVRLLMDARANKWIAPITRRCLNDKELAMRLLPEFMWLRKTPSKNDPTAQAELEDVLSTLLGEINVHSQIEVADQLLKERQYDSAVHLLECNTEIAAKHVPSWELLGEAYRQKNDVAQAQKAWKQVLTLDSLNTRIWERLVETLWYFGKFDELHETLEEADRVLKGNKRYHHAIGRILERAKDLVRALPHLEMAIKQEPLNADELLKLGHMLIHAGWPGIALPALSKARNLDPANRQIISELLTVLDSLDLAGINPVGMPHHSPALKETKFPDVLFNQIKHYAVLPPKPFDIRRIAIATGSLGAGGAERQVVLLANGLCQRFNDVKVVAATLSPINDNNFYLPMLHSQAVNLSNMSDSTIESALAEIEARGPEFAEKVRMIRLMRIFTNSHSGLRFFIEFTQNLPSIVHAWQDTINVEAGIAAVLAGVPRIILNVRSRYPLTTEVRRIVPWLAQGYRCLCALPSVTVVSNSAAGARDYEKNIGLPPGTIEVVHNGFDIESYRKKIDPKTLQDNLNNAGLKVSGPILGSVFRMTDEKQPLLWLRVASQVAKQMPNVRFLVIGDGPMRAEMLELAKTLGIMDKLYMPGRDLNVVPWLQAMDVLLLTSEIEGISNVLLEAQWLGLPVIAQRVGGIPETIDEENTGWLFEFGDIDGMMSRICHLLDNEGIRKQIKTIGPKFIEKTFGVERMVDEMVTVFDPIE